MLWASLLYPDLMLRMRRPAWTRKTIRERAHQAVVRPFLLSRSDEWFEEVRAEGRRMYEEMQDIIE